MGSKSGNFVSACPASRRREADNPTLDKKFVPLRDYALSERYDFPLAPVLPPNAPARVELFNQSFHIVVVITLRIRRGVREHDVFVASSRPQALLPRRKATVWE